MTRSGYTKFGVGMDESEKREYIRTAARKVFGRLGYHNATVKDIMAEAGISRRTFYSYYKSKEDVLIQLLDRLSMDIKQARDLEMPDQLKTVEELRDQIERLASAIIAIVIENRDIIKIIFEGLAVEDKVLSPRSEDIIGTFHALNKEYIETAQKRGLIYKSDAEIMSSMLLGIYLEMIRKFVVKNRRPPVDRFIKELLSLFDTGLFKTTKRPASPRG